MAFLRYTEREAWHKTAYQIITLFEYHKEYNPHIFGKAGGNGQAAETDEMDDIDVALGGL